MKLTMQSVVHQTIDIEPEEAADLIAGYKEQPYSDWYEYFLNTDRECQSSVLLVGDELEEVETNADRQRRERRTQPKPR